MNTSTLSLRADRRRLRTLLGTTFPRIEAVLEKLWSLSGRVSLPVTVSSTEASHLPCGMVLSLERADGVTCLELTRGMVWITGSPAHGDIILRAGETYEFGNRWPYVIEALTDAEFTACGQDYGKALAVSSAI